jgi:hypothetical protein
MGICWYCYWGWAKPVAEIYEEAVKRLNGDDTPLHFGPSHIVWDDENFDCAEACLKDFDKYTEGYTEEELNVVRWSLEELVKLPLKARDPEPDDYDDEHPEFYPPNCEVVRM